MKERLAELKFQQDAIRWQREEKRLQEERSIRAEEREHELEVLRLKTELARTQSLAGSNVYGIGIDQAHMASF